MALHTATETSKKKRYDKTTKKKLKACIAKKCTTQVPKPWNKYCDKCYNKHKSANGTRPTKHTKSTNGYNSTMDTNAFTHFTSALTTLTKRMEQLQQSMDSSTSGNDIPTEPASLVDDLIDGSDVFSAHTSYVLNDLYMTHNNTASTSK